MLNSKERFTTRVDAYVKYRPSYPKEVLDYLYETVGLRADSQVADIGAGTGIFSILLVERGSRVTAVEPNRAMREAAENVLGREANFRAVNGSAEDTGLYRQSIDFIVCAQSFHWFDRDAARNEFQRILKPGGKAALIWNSRLRSGSPFLEEYEQLLHQYAIDYQNVNHKNISPENLDAFFKSGSMETARFRNRQVFDFEGLRGRVLSSSYCPEPGHPRYEPMMQALRMLYDRNQQEGQVFFDYKTEVFWGSL